MFYVVGKIRYISDLILSHQLNMKAIKITSIVLIFLFFASFKPKLQKTIIHGKITTFNTISVANAEVTSKKTKTTVYSDSLGNFSIVCDLKDKIMVKAAGFNTASIKVKSLEDSLNVDLVIIGNEKKIDLAMETGHIHKDQLNLVKKYLEAKKQYGFGFMNMTDLIKGKFPGISIINDELVIRGIKSISNSGSLSTRNGALIIINGTEYNWNAVKSLDVITVKDIKILSSAKAARYGSGSSNGVMVITLVDE